MSQSIITPTSLKVQDEVRQKYPELDDRIIDYIYLKGYWRGKADQIAAAITLLQNSFTSRNKRKDE